MEDNNKYKEEKGKINSNILELNSRCENKSLVFNRDQLYNYLNFTKTSNSKKISSVLKDNYFEAFTSEPWPVENLRLFKDFNLSDCLQDNEKYSMSTFNFEISKINKSNLSKNQLNFTQSESVSKVESCMNCIKKDSKQPLSSNQTRKFIDNKNLVDYIDEFKNFQKLLLIGNASKFLYIVISQFKNNFTGNLFDENLSLLNNGSNSILIGPFNSLEILKMISEKTILSNTQVKLIDCFNFVGNKDGFFQFKEFANPEKLINKLTINQLANNLSSIKNQLNGNKETKQNNQKSNKNNKDKDQNKVKSEMNETKIKDIDDKLNASKESYFEGLDKVVKPEQENQHKKDKKDNKVKEMHKKEDEKATSSENIEFNRNENAKPKENNTVKKKKKKMMNIDISTGFFTMSEEESRYTQHFTLK